MLSTTGTDTYTRTRTHTQHTHVWLSKEQRTITGHQPAGLKVPIPKWVSRGWDKLTEREREREIQSRSKRGRTRGKMGEERKRASGRQMDGAAKGQGGSIYP